VGGDLVYREQFGWTAESLRLWVRRVERDAGERPGVTTGEQQRLKLLERENRELRRANEILRKAAAYLPRRSSTAAGRDGGVHRPVSRGL
jgi:transposase-like protein